MLHTLIRSVTVLQVICKKFFNTAYVMYLCWDTDLEIRFEEIPVV